MRLVIRKVQFAPEKPGPQPSAETTRHFLMSDRSLHLEASLDKEVGCGGRMQGLQCRGPWGEGWSHLPGQLGVGVGLEGDRATGLCGGRGDADNGTSANRSH